MRQVISSFPLAACLAAVQMGQLSGDEATTRPLRELRAPAPPLSSAGAETVHLSRATVSPGDLELSSGDVQTQQRKR